MVEKQPKAPVQKKGTTSKQDLRKSEGKTAERPTKPVAVDRPGFDLGGSTGKTSAGTGLGALSEENCLSAEGAFRSVLE